jgi:hypothetical protein
MTGCDAAFVFGIITGTLASAMALVMFHMFTHKG